MGMCHAHAGAGITDEKIQQKRSTGSKGNISQGEKPEEGLNTAAEASTVTEVPAPSKETQEAGLQENTADVSSIGGQRPAAESSQGSPLSKDTPQQVQFRAACPMVHDKRVCPPSHIQPSNRTQPHLVITCSPALCRQP